MWAMFILHTLLLSAALISRLTNITSSQNRSYSFVKVIRQSLETQLTVSRDVLIDKWAKSQIAGGCIPQTYRYILNPVYCYRLFGGQLTVFFIWLKPSTLFSSLLLWNSAASCVRGTYAPPPPPLDPAHNHLTHLQTHKLPDLPSINAYELLFRLHLFLSRKIKDSMGSLTTGRKLPSPVMTQSWIWCVCGCDVVACFCFTLRSHFTQCTRTQGKCLLSSCGASVSKTSVLLSLFVASLLI